MDNYLEVINQKIEDGPFSASWDSLENYTIPEWYKDAKFGIFIHWGPYCVPAYGGEWYPRQMYLQNTPEYEHHIRTYGHQSEFGYKDFIKDLTAEKFDADEWAKLFKKAGAKFIVPVAEHHDGFQMYESEFSKWNAVNMGPKKDIIGELASAVKDNDMIFGLSSHRAEHWWFFDGGTQFDSDVNDSEYADLYGPAKPKPINNLTDSSPDDTFLENWLMRTCELVDRYEPQIVWFDWWIQNLAFKPYLKSFGAYYYNSADTWGKGVAINYKDEAYPIQSGVFDIERGQLSGIRPLFWQTDTSVSKNSWGYIKNHDYKQSNSIVCDLIDIVSKNGALLLNIGPKADGTIPEKEKEILLDIGKWLNTNGEAIYCTRPWFEYGEGPTKVASGSFTDTKRIDYTDKDIRFTQKDNQLYAIGLKWPKMNTVTITKLANHHSYPTPEINSIELLGWDGELEWHKKDQGIKVYLPTFDHQNMPYVLKISCK